MPPGDPSSDLPPVEIRLVEPGDTDALRALLEGIEAFRPDEVECALEVIEDFHRGDRDYYPFILWEGERAAGFVCFGPVPLTEATYDLYWIAVGPDFRKRGYGARLMEFFIEEIRKEGGRLVVSETSSLPSHAGARRLYLRCGFEEKTRIEGYYGEGDDLVIYTRGLRKPDR